MKKKFPYYPIYIDIEDHAVLIVGGGNVCARKAETMIRYGARVTIVSPEITDEIAAWERDKALVVQRKRYEEADLDGASIVIASTDEPCVNARVARDCRRRRIPVNVVDVTHLCEFIVPAIIQKGSLQIAVSTGGKSPALGRTLKEELQRTIGPEYAEVNDLLGTLRKSAKRVLPTDVDRKRFFDGIIAAGILDMLRDGRRREAYEAIARACQTDGVAISAELQERLGGDDVVCHGHGIGSRESGVGSRSNHE
ncbi:MAG: bifunctional precorrin-2 dehydrogenase/sirohydrochlorin ferrochelatase [Acidobacteriota bacterium]|nr:bifunctional precorrin-2 dehydrogenase/sirohydrochlorin ferrochelatase [Acidobacteriota bacterium]